MTGTLSHKIKAVRRRFSGNREDRRLLPREIRYRLARRRHESELRRRFDEIVVAVPAGARIAVSSLDLPALEDLPPELHASATRLVQEADEILGHRMRFLEPESRDYGRRIDWCQDPVTGHRWALGYHRNLKVRDLDTRDDPKRVWELSRGHQLLTLARAGRLRPDRAAIYFEELAAQLSDWIDSNPVGLTVNWANAMEAGIRVSNWLQAIRVMGGADVLPDRLRQRVTVSLQQHGRFIRNNLEGTPRMRSNHFVGDLLGLASIGVALEGDDQASRWAEEASRWLDREILAQVHPDGGDFEASLPYHGLVLEMFTVAVRELRRGGHEPGPEALERLVGMVDLACAMRHPDGRLPQFGDSDSGRVLPGGFDRGTSLDPVIWQAAFQLDLGAPLEGPPDPELAWNEGREAWLELDASARRRSPGRKLFPDSGLAVLSQRGIHVAARCGDVGQAGNGGHAHNDALSFELSFDGIPLVIDPGTFAYTGDPESRNLMRSTAVHSTPQVDGLEINPVDEARLFQLDQVAWPSLGPVGEDSIEMSHDGFSRPGVAVRVERRLRITEGEEHLEVRDRFLGEGTHSVRIPFPLAPGWTIHRSLDQAVLSGHGMEMLLDLTGDLELTEVEAFCSPSYGVRAESVNLVASGRLTFPATVLTRIGRNQERQGRPAGQGD